MNINFEEYKTRLLEIRRKVNELLDDIGATYSTEPELLEKVLNIAMNGDLTNTQGDKIKTEKIISVRENTGRQPEYI